MSGGLLNDFFFYKTVRAQRNIHKVRETTIKPKKRAKHKRRENKNCAYKTRKSRIYRCHEINFFFLPFLFIPTCLLIVQVFVMNTKICGFVLNMNILKRNSYMVPWMGFVWIFRCWMLLCWFVGACKSFFGVRIRLGVVQLTLLLLVFHNIPTHVGYECSQHFS